MLIAVIRFYVWEPVRKEICMALVTHDSPVGTKQFEREINQYAIDSFPDWQATEDVEITQIKWEIDGIGGAYYINHPSQWTEEVDNRELTLEDLMYDYALWVGNVTAGSGGEHDLVDPWSYIQAFCETAHTPARGVVMRFLRTFYSEETTQDFMDCIVWDKE